MRLFDSNQDEADVIGELAGHLDEAGVNNLMTDHAKDGRGAPESLGDRRADLSFDHLGPGKTFIEVDAERDAAARSQLNDMADNLDPKDRLLSVTEEESLWWKR